MTNSTFTHGGAVGFAAKAAQNAVSTKVAAKFQSLITRANLAFAKAKMLASRSFWATKGLNLLKIHALSAFQALKMSSTQIKRASFTKAFIQAKANAQKFTRTNAMGAAMASFTKAFTRASAMGVIKSNAENFSLSLSLSLSCW